MRKVSDINLEVHGAVTATRSVEIGDADIFQVIDRTLHTRNRAYQRNSGRIVAAGTADTGDIS